MPAKKGRKTKAPAETEENNVEKIDEEQAPVKKRGRQAKAKTDLVEETEDVKPKQTKGRGNKKVEEVIENEDEETESDKIEAKDEGDGDKDVAAVEPKRRGRAAKKDTKDESKNNEEKQKETKTRGKKTAVKKPSEEAPVPEKKARGAAKNQKAAKEEPVDKDEADAKPKRRGRKQVKAERDNDSDAEDASAGNGEILDKEVRVNVEHCKS